MWTDKKECKVSEEQRNRQFYVSFSVHGLCQAEWNTIGVNFKKDHISALYFLLPGSGSALLPHNAYLALYYFLEYITCTKIISEISRTHCVDVVGVQKRIKWQQSMDLVQLKTFPENWDSKAPSVGTLFAYLETYGLNYIASTYFKDQKSPL